MECRALTADEMCRAIEGKKPPRVPIALQFWIYPELFNGKEAAVRQLISKYPYDLELYQILLPGYKGGPKGHPEYMWIPRYAKDMQNASIDARCYIPDWDELDEILEEMPNPSAPFIFDEPRKKANSDVSGKYRLGHFHYFLFERFWSFRGMENALVDMMECPDKVHQLFEKLVSIYSVWIRGFKSECNCNGILLTDDIGAQEGLIFSPSMFKEFYQPYYKQIVDLCHSLDMHFWFHTCGNITEVLDPLIEDISIDVLHPIQKYAMDLPETAKKIDGRICVWGGMDVQHTMPFGTADEVREETRWLIATFDRPEGRLILTAGNGLTPDIPLENIDAFFQESLRYGIIHRSR